jgi:hypothetical protein
LIIFVTRGILTRAGAAILHKLRVLGNGAAHEVSPHATDRLKLGIEVAEHMLEGAHIYTIKVKRTFKKKLGKFSTLWIKSFVLTVFRANC